MTEESDALSATVEYLPLPSGLYLVSVRSTASAQRVDEPTDLALPAIQIGTCPGAPSGQVEFMAGPTTSGGWLCEPYDQIIVKIKEPSAVLQLTSLKAPGMAPLEIGIKRLDRDAAEFADQTSGQLSRAPLPVPSTQQSIALEVIPHIQSRGDVPFADSEWAGFVGEQLWIESFSIAPLDDISPETIEYKGVTTTGVETPWVTAGGTCGTRGIFVPLAGFAVRIKPRSGTPSLVCEYGALFGSGAKIGPCSDGELCRSDDATDPIEAIWVSISQANSEALASVEAAPNIAESGAETDPAVAETIEDEPSGPENIQIRRSRVGPRFSVFREVIEPEQE